MTIAFTSTRQADSTHRVSDGTESSYFAWPDGATWDDVLDAYEAGYETDVDADVKVRCFRLVDNELQHRGRLLA